MKRRIIKLSLALVGVLSIVGIREFVSWKQMKEIEENFNPEIERTFHFRAFNSYDTTDEMAEKVLDSTFSVKGLPTLDKVIMYFSKNVVNDSIIIGDKHVDYGYSMISISGISVKNFNFAYWNATSSTHRECIGDGNSISNRKNSCRKGISGIIFNEDDVKNEFTWYLSRYN